MLINKIKAVRGEQVSYYCSIWGRMVPAGSTECPHIAIPVLVSNNTTTSESELTIAIAEIERLKKEAIMLRDFVSNAQLVTGCSDKYCLGMWNAFEFVLSMQDRRAPSYKTECKPVDFSQIKEEAYEVSK